MERFVEDQASLQSYDTTPLPLTRQQVYLFLSLPVCRRSRLTTEGGGGGEKSYDRENARTSINHSILSVEEGRIVPIFMWL
jgi:hypothetical protein